MCHGAGRLSPPLTRHLPAHCLCPLQSKLQERTGKTFDPLAPGLPRGKDQTVDLRMGVVALFEKVSALRAKAESENRLIYFKSIPRDVTDLPELPARKEDLK